MFAGDLAHGLEKAQLEGDGFFADHGRRLHHLFGRLELAFGIDDFGAPLAFGLRLVWPSRRSCCRQGHVLDFNRSDFDSPRLGFGGQ